MKWLTWRPGRRKTGYHNMLLLQWRWPILWDLYLLRFGPGSHAPEHLDEVPGYRHYRINLILRQAKRGGEFISDHCLYNGARLKVFRSDRPHKVTKVEQGTRYVLSLGICLKGDDHE